MGTAIPHHFTTQTDSVTAAKSNVAPEMFRAITRTVLFDHTAASSSMNRVDDTREADAKLPTRATLTVTSISDVANGAKLGRSQDVLAANSRCPDCGRVVRVKDHFLCLSGIGHNEHLAAEGQSEMRDLDGQHQPADFDLLVAPIEPAALAGRESQWNEGLCEGRAGLVGLPALNKALH